jgi:hypothetical protein
MAVFRSNDLRLPEKTSRLNQLHYGLRKPKGHGLIERDALIQGASKSHIRKPASILPDSEYRPHTPLETAYHRADTAIQCVLEWSV